MENPIIKYQKGTYNGGVINPAVVSYKYNLKDYDKLAKKKRIDQVPESLKVGIMQAKVRGAINNSVKDVLLPTLAVPAGIIAGIPMVGAAIASPIATLGGLVGGTAGQVATNKVVKTISNNKYPTWGNWISQKTGLNPIVSEFTNPGGLIGGGIGVKGAKNAINTGKNLIKPGVGKSATTLIKKGVKSTGELLNKPVQNAYKLNPWAFKPSSNNLYRGLGESGVKDAFETGVLRPRPAELRDIGKDIVTDSGKTFRLKGKTFDKTYYSPDFKTADRYGNGYIVEVPKNSATFNNRYSAGKDWSMHTTEHIPIDKSNILKKHWLMGYKKINAPIVKNVVKEPIIQNSINNSILENSQLNSSDVFVKATKRAKENINQLLDNPIIQETMARNTELSKRLGIKFPLIPTTDPNSIMSRTTSINEYRRMMLDKPINVKVDNLPLHVGANYNRSTKDLIYNWNKLKNAQIKDIDQFANHEVLHHGEFGTTRIESEKARRLLKSEKELDILANENPELLYIDQHYLRQPGETYTNVMGDLRTELGLKIGQSYPGKLNIATMLNNYTGDKKFVIDAFKLNVPRDYKRVWDALTGKYFAPIIGATGIGASTIKIPSRKKGGKFIKHKWI